MCPKIRCDGESKKFCKIFWELNRALICFRAVNRINRRNRKLTSRGRPYIDQWEQGSSDVTAILSAREPSVLSNGKWSIVQAFLNACKQADHVHVKFVKFFGFGTAVVCIYQLASIVD
jgi:hypothetical protein